MQEETEQSQQNPQEPTLRHEPTRVVANEHGLKTQAIRFIISGVISAVVDLGLTAIFQFGFGQGAGLARTIGFIFGTLTAYLINRRWTFRAEPSLRRFVWVCILYALTYVINWSLYKYGFEWLAGFGWANWLASVSAFVVAQGTATVVNFFFQRWVIFRTHREAA